jgi:phosphatidylinositol alpha-1,6-mannosyltransferase
LNILIATHEYPPYPGGIGRYCAEVRAAALSQGHQVDVLAPDFAQPVRASQSPDEAGVYRFPGDVYTNKKLFTVIRALRRQLATRAYDVVHIADWPLLLALPWSGLPKRAKTIMTFHGTDAIVLGRSRSARWLRARQAINRLDRICANSAFTLSLVERELAPPVAVDRRVTHLGVAPYWAEPASDSERHEVRRLCGAGTGDRIVLTIARLDPRKGHLRALQAIAQMPEDQRRTVCYLAIGRAVDPAYAAHLQAEAQRLGVRATFAGAQPDNIVRAAYAESRAFLLAAEPAEDRVEGFGLVFLEAAYQGLPTVSTATHAVPEVVKDRVTGYLAAPGDTADLTLQLLAMLEANAAGQFAPACVAHAREFTWQRCAALTYSNL